MRLLGEADYEASEVLNITTFSAPKSIDSPHILNYPHFDYCLKGKAVVRSIVTHEGITQ
jgi:hypothetical protein